MSSKKSSRSPKKSPSRSSKKSSSSPKLSPKDYSKLPNEILIHKQNLLNLIRLAQTNKSMYYRLKPEIDYRLNIIKQELVPKFVKKFGKINIKYLNESFYNDIMSKFVIIALILNSIPKNTQNLIFNNQKEIDEYNEEYIYGMGYIEDIYEILGEDYYDEIFFKVIKFIRSSELMQ